MRERSRPGGSRTHTVRFLKPLPLPLGYRSKVTMGGLEPPTSALSERCADQLRHIAMTALARNRAGTQFYGCRPPPGKRSDTGIRTRTGCLLKTVPLPLGYVTRGTSLVQPPRGVPQV